MKYEFFNQYFLLFQIINMLNFFMSLFSFNDAKKKDANKKKIDAIIPDDIEKSEKIDDHCDDEEYDTFFNEINESKSVINPIKKTSSLNLLPKCQNTEIKINIEYNPKYIYPDSCSNCKAKIYKKFNPTYHAYDRLWCYKCWSDLEINTN